NCLWMLLGLSTLADVGIAGIARLASKRRQGAPAQSPRRSAACGGGIAWLNPSMIFPFWSSIPFSSGIVLNLGGVLSGLLIYIGTVFEGNANLASAAANLARRSLTIHPNDWPAATFGSTSL